MPFWVFISLSIWLDSCLLLILKWSILELEVLHARMEYGTLRCDVLRNNNKERQGSHKMGRARILRSFLFPVKANFFQENF